jgi:hypothetical protein
MVCWLNVTLDSYEWISYFSRFNIFILAFCQKNLVGSLGLAEVTSG